jgi:hypothetical protein
MKTNIALFRGNVAAPALQASRANDPKQNRPSEACHDAQAPRVLARQAPVMIWRINTTTGRLECRWSLERNALTDEGVSCANLLRRAA